AWTKGGHTALTNLLTFQSSANGGFTFPGNPGPDAFTTSQVPAGLDKVPFPGSTSWTADAALPAGVCAALATPRPTGATPPATASTALLERGADDGGLLPMLLLISLAALGGSLRLWSRRLSR
ncbi:MAG TPA: hypothetical protein VGJ17_07685, partial [Candidatus Limnocylindrales bacterium]